MTRDEVLAALEAAGTAQTRKTYARHGVSGRMFGVSYALLGQLKKQIGVDHVLAQELWQSENHDARVLATMIADPVAASPALLNRWIKELDNPVLSGELARFAAETRFARKKAIQWAKNSRDLIGQTGWQMCAQLARNDPDLTDDELTEWLEVIAEEIHSRPNRTRSAMNQCVIAIGGRNPALRRVATEFARRIGPVEIDHGDTDCQTPDAGAYIQKTWEKRESQQARKAAR